MIPTSPADNVGGHGRLSERLAEARARIVAAGGEPDQIGIVAVTKGFGVDACRAALDLGIGALGENYAGELFDKAAALGSHESSLGPNWHFLGAIQRNKLARLASVVAVYEGVDRLEEGIAIARHAPGASVFVEVNGTDSPERGGVGPNEVSSLVEGLYGLGLDVRGLMTVAPQGDLVGARRVFCSVRALVDRLGLAEASMGMSDDLEVAVQEGTTLVRLGRALFGPRRAS